MELRFRNKGLRETCEKRVVAVRSLGDIGSKKLRHRLADIEAARSVSELHSGRPHPLHGDRDGQFSLDLAGGCRLVFSAGDAPTPRHADGSIDWSRVTIVIVEYIGNYHD